MGAWTSLFIAAVLGFAEAPPATAPAATTAPATRRTLSETAQTLDRFFDALRRRELDAARAMCWVPREGLKRHFDREMPSESEKMATGKRRVAVLDGRSIGDLGIAIFNEDVTDKKNFGGKIEALWLIKQEDQWKVNVAIYKVFAAELSDGQRVRAAELRKWLTERKREIIEEEKTRSGR